VVPRLPRNVKIGQVRRTVEIVSSADWNKLSKDERAAADALALHVWWRCRQSEHPAFEGTDCVFLTDRYVQRLLRAVGASKTGEKAAAAAIKIMQAHGWMVDTGGRRSRADRRKASTGPSGSREEARFSLEGGKDAQPTFRSFWWRIFRVPHSPKLSLLSPLPGRTRRLMTFRNAERTAEHLSGETVDATAGEADVGLAIRDALATFPADEIVVAVRPHEQEGLVESHATETAPQHRIEGVPVRYVVIGD